jgi:aryl-alcohol dehydrogenase-like predicted oxidoreductase
LNATVLPACRALGSAWCRFRRSGAASWEAATSGPKTCPPATFRRGLPRLQGENYDANRSLVTQLELLAARVGASPGQVALAWLLGQGTDVVPIFGTTRRTRLRENLAATQLKLAEREQRELEDVFRPGSATGARYGSASLAMLDGAADGA